MKWWGTDLQGLLGMRRGALEMVGCGCLRKRGVGVAGERGSSHVHA